MKASRHPKRHAKTIELPFFKTITLMLLSSVLLQILRPHSNRFRTLMRSLEEQPLTFIQTSQELRAITQSTTRVMGVVCDLGRTLLERLFSTLSASRLVENHRQLCNTYINQRIQDILIFEQVHDPSSERVVVRCLGA